MDMILQTIDTAGAASWEDLVDWKVVVLFDKSGRSVGIAHLTDEHKVPVFQELADAWKAHTEAS